MKTPHSPATARNPFSTCRVRPGATPYLFLEGESVAKLLDRLRRNGWCGQIIGPHGSGKSALLATLIPAIEDAGRRTLLIELHDRQRRLPVDVYRTPERDSLTLVIVDGYEQLGHFSRFRLRRFCRRRGIGLLATGHGPLGFPDLFHTTTTFELAQQIVGQLLGEQPSVVTPEEVVERFSHHAGNLREMLFDLYDLYERRR